MDASSTNIISVRGQVMGTFTRTMVDGKLRPLLMLRQFETKQFILTTFGPIQKIIVTNMLVLKVKIAYRLNVNGLHYTFIQHMSHTEKIIILQESFVT